MKTRFLRAVAIAVFMLLASPAVSQNDELHRQAEQGSADAQFNLGMMYIDGEGVPQDDAEAAQWFRLAAEQGHAEAQFSLGFMYYTGAGGAVPQSYVEAYIWFSLAAISSADDVEHAGIAASARDNTAPGLSASDLAAAEQEIARRLELMRSP